MRCLQENFIGAERHIIPNVGLFNSVNLWDPIPGTGVVSYKLSGHVETIDEGTTQWTYTFPASEIKIAYRIRPEFRTTGTYRLYAESAVTVAQMFELEDQSPTPPTVQLVVNNAGAISFYSASSVPSIGASQVSIAQRTWARIVFAITARPNVPTLDGSGLPYMILSPNGFVSAGGAYAGRGPSHSASLGSGHTIEGQPPQIIFRKGWCHNNPGYWQLAL